MSLKRKLNLISDDQRQKISDDLTIKLEDKKNKFKPATEIEIYDIVNDDLIVPLAYGINELKFLKPKSDSYPKIHESVIFTGALRPAQVTIKDEAIANLNRHGACMISAYPGFGKTCTGIYITSKIKLKTLIIINRLVLMDQWKNSIISFCPNACVQCLHGKQSKNFDRDPDYFIVNAINVPKYGREFFKDIGTVIVDEAHLIMSRVLSQSMFYLFPKYVIGLSATPYRPDGLDKLMTLFFTEHKIIRNLVRPHTVYQVNTKFKPEVQVDRFGKVIWGQIIEQQCNNPIRDEIIFSIVKKFQEKNFIILTKRVEHASTLFQKLKDFGESSSIYTGEHDTFDEDARILVGTTNKCGVGFDHKKMDAIILASDIEEYFIQYLGRVFRTEHVEPIIFDLVDDNSILKKHFATRKKVYKEVGGVIKLYQF